MRFKPAKVFPSGYGLERNAHPARHGRNHTKATWGGNVIRDKTGKYHVSRLDIAAVWAAFFSRWRSGQGYFAAMSADCPYSTWGSNSRVEHAVADNITGPYAFVDVAVPVWAHTPAPIALKDGSFAIVHEGTCLLYTSPSPRDRG